MDRWRAMICYVSENENDDLSNETKQEWWIVIYLDDKIDKVVDVR